MSFQGSEKVCIWGGESQNPKDLGHGPKKKKGFEEIGEEWLVQTIWRCYLIGRVRKEAERPMLWKQDNDLPQGRHRS